MSTVGEKIVSVAERFESLVEIRSNAVFDDPKTPGPDRRAAEFVEMIKRAGHRDGWAYCMSMCEGVWHVSYEELGASRDTLSKIAMLLNPHVMSSFSACMAAGLISKIPALGAVGFMQKGSSSSGHAFIVTDPGQDWIRTIEGNTSPTDPNERDAGIGTGGVWRKRRLMSLARKKSGLWIRGFMHPFPL